MAKYAYVRAMQKGQSLSGQIQAVTQFGVPKTNIITDEQPGVRSRYGELLQILKKGDLLVIKSLAALNDGYENIACEWQRIAEVIGADICVLDLPAIDTRICDDRNVIISAVTQMLNYCAEKERAHSALQAKGIRYARQRGVKFGRPPKKYSEEFIATVAMYAEGRISLEEALAATNMKQSSFYYHKHKLEVSGVVPVRAVGVSSLAKQGNANA
mgnify:FL=1